VAFVQTSVSSFQKTGVFEILMAGLYRLDFRGAVNFIQTPGEEPLVGVIGVQGLFAVHADSILVSGASLVNPITTVNLRVGDKLIPIVTAGTTSKVEFIDATFGVSFLGTNTGF